MAFYTQHGSIPEGDYTSTIYGMIKEQKYEEAIEILTLEMQTFPRSRAALSLLGYCYYMMQDFHSAVQMYELLVKTQPDCEEYKVYYAQSLYKAGLYEQAQKAALRVDHPQYHQYVQLFCSLFLFFVCFVL